MPSRRVPFQRPQPGPSSRAIGSPKSTRFELATVASDTFAGCAAASTRSRASIIPCATTSWSAGVDDTASPAALAP